MPGDGTNLQDLGTGAGAATGVLITLAALWQKVFGKGKADVNSQGRRIGDLETEIGTLKALHAERNQGDEFKRKELEELKTDRTEAKVLLKEVLRRLESLERSGR